MTASVPGLLPFTLPMLADGPWGAVFLVLLVVLVAQILEDVAVLWAASLVATGALTLPVAVAAAWVGIVVGDLWLYGAGRFGARIGGRMGGGVARRIGMDRIERARRLLLSNDLAALCLARVVPFLRLPVFTGAGAARMPFGRFATICALLALPWTLALMSLGQVAARALPDMPWAPVAVALLLILLPRAVRRFGKRSP